MKFLLLILFLILLFFGARKLPELGGALGKSLKNFKKGLEGKDGDDAKLVNPDDDDKPKA